MHGLSSQLTRVIIDKTATTLNAEQNLKIKSKSVKIEGKKIILDNGNNEAFALHAQLATELSSLVSILSTHTGLEATAPFVAKFSALSTKYKGFS